VNDTVHSLLRRVCRRFHTDDRQVSGASVTFRRDPFTNQYSHGGMVSERGRSYGEG
jgi:hypothetical protein